MKSSEKPTDAPEMSSSEHNLKSQLSDLQKRLSQSTINSPKRPSPRKENEDDGSHDRVEEGSDANKRHELQSKKSFNFLSKKDKRISLPAFDNSKSLSTPTKNNGKDMNFVVGLSENLLLECRKLQAENQTKSSKLRTLEEEYEKVKISNNSLMAKLNESIQNEEKYKDSNWELELKLQQVSQDFKTVTDNYHKSQAELNKQLELSHDIRSELDEMNINKLTLEKEYSNNKVSNTNQIQDLKSHVDELNDENYKLNDEIEELRRQLEAANNKPAEPQLKNVPILKPTEDESSDEEYNEPPISPVKTIPINNTALESETLRGSLSQAQHTIAKLRAQILKLRANEISNKQGTPIANKKSQSPALKKSIRSLNEPGNRSFHVLKPSSNRSSKNIYEDSMDTSDLDEEWENFEGDTTNSQFVGASSPSVKHPRPMSMTQDLIEDTESEFDESELQGVAPLSSELKILSEEDVKSYAEQHNLVIIPSEEYQKLSKHDSTNDGIIAPATDFGFVSLPNDNSEEKEALREAEFYTYAKERNLVVLTKDEAAAREQELSQKSEIISQLELQVSDADKAKQQYDEEAAQYRKQLENALNNTKKGLHENKALKEKLSNPSKDYVHEKATGHGLHLLSALEYTDIQSQLSHFKSSYETPSDDFLHEKALSKNMKLVHQKEYTDLIAKLDTLNMTLDSKEQEITDLNNRLSEQLNASKLKESELVETVRALKEKIQESQKDCEQQAAKITELTASLTVLQKSLDEPSIDYITEKATGNGYKIIHSKDHEKQLSEFNNKSSEFQATIAELTTKSQGLESKLKQKVTEVENLNVRAIGLQKSIDEPDHDYILKKASSRGFKVLNAKDHEKQLSEFNESLKASRATITELSAKTERLEFDLEQKANEVEVLNSKAADMQKSIEDPHQDYIREKGTAKGLKVLEIAVYEEELSQLNKTICSLKEELDSEKAKAAKKTEISNKLIQQLKEKIELLQAERLELNTNIDEFKQQLEHANGSLSIMKSKIDNPTHEYLSEKSSKQGLTMLPKLAHVSLLERANRSIYDLAKEENVVVLKPDEHHVLKSKAYEPTLEHLISKAEAHKHTIVSSSEFSDLLKKANTPIEEAAGAKGMVLLSQDDHIDMKKKLESPTLDDLHKHLQSHKHVAVPKDDYKSLTEKANRTVESLAEEKGLVLLPQGEHDELLRKSQNPSFDELKDFAASHNHVIIKKNEYEFLVTRSEKTVEELAEEEERVVLSKSDHAELSRKAVNPTVEELIAACSAVGYVASHTAEHTELVKNSNKSVHDLAKEQDLIVIPSAEHKELVSAIESPSLEYLSKKSEAENHIIIKKEDHEDLIQRADKTIDDHAKELNAKVLSEKDYNTLVNPSADLVSKYAKKLGLIAIAKDNHDKLVSQSQTPSLEHITEKAQILGYDVVDSTDYQALCKNVESPSKDFIRSKASKLGLIAVPEVDYKKLKDETSKLKKDFADKSLLVQKVSSDGSVVLKKDDYDAMVQKANTAIEDLAKAEGKVVIPKEDYTSLLEPSKDAIVDHASKYDLVAIPKDTHHTLLRENQSPSVDHLSSKASVHGHVVVPKDHYEEIKSTSETPTFSFLTEKALSLNSVVIPTDVHKSLKERAEKSIDQLAKENHKVAIDEDHYESLRNPSVDAVKESAECHGLVTIVKEDHESLQKQLNTPSLEFLKEKAKDHSHVVLPAEELNDLKEVKENPTAEFLSTKGASQGLVVVPEEEFVNLKSHLEKSIEDLASEKGLVVVDKEEYASLKSPSKDSLTKAAQASGLSILETAAYEKLLRPSREDLVRHAENQKLTILSNGSFEDLKSKSERTAESLAEESSKVLLSKDEHEALLNPPKDTIISLASGYDLVAIPQKEYDHITHPSVEYLKEHSDNLGLSLIPKEEFAVITEKSSKTIDDLAKESDSIVLSKSQHNSLLNPGKDSVIEQAAKHGLVTLSSEDHSSLLNPSREVLSVHADREGMKLLPVEEFKSLSNPTKDAIRQRASDIGLVAVEQNEFDNLHSLAHEPSSEHITEKAALLGFSVLPKSEHSKLSNTVSNPTKDFIQSGAAKHGLVTIPKEEHASLLQPSKDTLSKHATREGMSLISMDEYYSLSSPSKETIKQKANDLGLVAVDQNDYNNMLSLAHEPSSDHIMEKAAVLGYSVLSKDEHNKMSNIVSNPTKEFIQHGAAKHGLVTIPKEEHASLLHPSKDVLAEHAARESMRLIPVEEYQILSNPSKDNIKESAIANDLIAVEKDEFDNLYSLANNPSLDHLTEKANLLEYTLLTKAEHSELARSIESPSKEYIQSGAGKHNLLTISKDGKDKFVEDYLNEKNLVSVNRNEFSKLRDLNAVELPEVSDRLQQLGYVAVDKESYRKLSADITKAEVINFAENFGLKAIPNDQYEKLMVGPKEEELVAIAESHNMALVARPELDLLKAQAEQPDRDTVAKHADRFGSVLITKIEYDSLQNSLNKVSKADLENKAAKIDHVVIPKSEYEQFVRIEEEQASQSPTTPISKVAANKDYFESIHKSAEKDKRKLKVFESARSLGFVPVAADEYKHLLEHQKDHILTKTDIYKGAKDFDLAILPVDEYRNLLKNRVHKEDLTYDDLEALAKRFNLRLAKPSESSTSSRAIEPFTLHTNESAATFSSASNESEFTDALDRIPSNASTIRDNTSSELSADQLKAHAERLGFKLIPVGDISGNGNSAPQLESDSEDTDDDDDDNYDTIVERSITEPLNRDELSRRANELGLVVLEEGQFENLQSREISISELKEKANELGLKVLGDEELTTLELLKSPNEDYIREVSKKLGLVTLTEPQIKEIEERAVSDINEDDIQEYANNMGLILLERDRFDSLVESSKITKDIIVEKASDYDLVAISSKEYASLKNQTSKGDGLSKEAIVAGASALGLSVLSSYEVGSRDAKPEAPSKESFASHADDMGLKVLPADEYDDLVSRSNRSIVEDDIKQYALDKGLTIIPNDEFTTLKEKVPTEITRDTLVQKGQEFGLVTLPIGEYQKLKSNSDYNASSLLSKSDVVQRATEFDLVAVSKEELDVLRAKAGIKTKEELEKPKPEPPILSREEIESGARIHGLLAIPENSFIATNISRIPDVNNVVVLPVTYYNKLTKSEQLNLEKISNDELQAQARKRGFHITYGEFDSNKDTSNLTRKNTITSLTSSNSRRNLAEAAATAAYQEYENQPKTTSRSSSRARSISRSGSTTNIHQRDVSIDGGISLMTDASLSEPNIIPALTQTVIGEFLYKYYRRLGPLSSISESRHERYFWIHPYTLTLYWSTTNPVLGNPSIHKTRAAAIIGVESVHDNNPLPAGLYHKSIIVHSQTRSIKITCPTRQRHNIWYNSLRYLIQRSMDGINLEEDLDLLKDNPRQS